jgi:hypothetical protein
VVRDQYFLHLTRRIRWSPVNLDCDRKDPTKSLKSPQVPPHFFLILKVAISSSSLLELEAFKKASSPVYLLDQSEALADHFLTSLQILRYPLKLPVQFLFLLYLAILCGTQDFRTLFRVLVQSALIACFFLQLLCFSLR